MRLSLSNWFCFCNFCQHIKGLLLLPENVRGNSFSHLGSGFAFRSVVSVHRQNENNRQEAALFIAA